MTINVPDYSRKMKPSTGMKGPGEMNNTGDGKEHKHKKQVAPKSTIANEPVIPSVSPPKNTGTAYASPSKSRGKMEVWNDEGYFKMGKV